jgi:hypothetical protein
MVDERDKARARLGLPPLDATDDATSDPIVDEQTKIAKQRAAGKKETAAERLARIKAAREKVQAGEDPDNPMPTEDPGPGMYWANFGGTWRKYKSVTDTPPAEDDSGFDPDADPDEPGSFSKSDPIAALLAAQEARAARAEEAAAAAAEEAKKQERKSAYDLLFAEFDRYGLGALVTPLKSLIEEGVSPSEFTLRLRETDAYKKRFAANAQRIAKGLRALSEAEYIGTEDQYQDVMRRYGMPESYYAKGDLGRQEGFEKFLAGDVSAVELEDRIQTAQKRVMNANPEIATALRQFYPGISNGDILAYTLDPTNAIEDIKRKVTYAEIGGAALSQGLQTGLSRAAELASMGVSKETAMQGYGSIGSGLQRGSQLASIYGQDAYTQATAEEEVFGLSGSTQARKKRQDIVGLERAAFGGQTGITSGALARDSAGSF